MASIVFLKARKEHMCGKCKKVIRKGEEYQRAAMFEQDLFNPKKKPFIRCNACGVSYFELSASEYTQEIGAIVNDWKSQFTVHAGVWNSIAERLKDIKSRHENQLSRIDESDYYREACDELEEEIVELQEAIDKLEKGDSIQNKMLESALNEMPASNHQIIFTELDVRKVVGKSMAHSAVYDALLAGEYSNAKLTEAEKEQLTDTAQLWKKGFDDYVGKFVDDALSGLSY